MELETLKIGNLTFQVARQAKLVFYAWVIILASMVVMLFMDTSHVAMRVFVFIMYLGFAALSVYTVNCFVVGQCNNLAWIYVALLMLMAVINIISLLLIAVFMSSGSAAKMPAPVKALRRSLKNM